MVIPSVPVPVVIPNCQDWTNIGTFSCLGLRYSFQEIALVSSENFDPLLTVSISYLASGK